MLSVVAATQTVTQWHHIPGHGTGIVRARIIDGYPMIKGNHMGAEEIAQWSPADGTAAIEVVQSSCLVDCCERKGQPGLTGNAAIMALF